MSSDKEKAPGAEAEGQTGSSGIPNTESTETATDANKVSQSETDATTEAGNATDEATATSGNAPEAETEPEAIEEPQPVAEAAAPPRRDGFARLVAVVALLIGLAVYGLSQRAEVPGGSAARLAQLEDQIAALQTAAPASAIAQPDTELATGLDAARSELSALQMQISNLAAAVAAVEAHTHPEVASPETGAALSALEERVGVLELRPVAAPAPAAVAPTDSSVGEQALSGLQSGLDALKQQIAALQSRLSEVASAQGETAASVGARLDGMRQDAQAALSRETAALSARLEELATQAQATGDQAKGRLATNAAQLLAIAQLRDAAALQRSFEGAWQGLVSLGVDASEWPAISGTAPEGVATLDELKARFADLGSRAIVADQVGGEEGWIDGALKRMGNLVRVRRTGELEGTTAEAIIARAETRLSQGEWQKALAELDGLSDAAKKELAAWRASATRRLALDEAIKKLHRMVLDNVSGEGN